ncbi:MAG: hypothetical protein ACO1N6_01415 [Microcella sp.]
MKAMMPAGGHLLIGAALMTVLMLTGCSGPANQEVDGVIAVVGREPTGLQELAQGELTTTRGGCLALEADGRTFLLVWPPDVEIATESGRTTVIVPKADESLTLGGPVIIGGGLLSADAAQTFSIPAGCVGFDGVYLVNGLD